MRLILLILAVTCFSSCAALRTENVCYFEKQQEITGTAKEQYEDFDKDLNYIYGTVIAYLPQRHDDCVSLQTLIDAEKLWEEYRDAQCEAVIEFYRGRTKMLPTVKYYCLRDLTKQRVMSLIGAYEDRDNLYGGPIFEIDRQKYYKEEGKEKENEKEVIEPDAGHFQTQREMNQIEYEGYRKLDKELNEICGEIMEFLSQDADNYEAKQKFMYAQEMWGKYRDADCEAAVVLYRGGTIFNMMKYNWLRSTVYQQIDFLKSAYCEIWEQIPVSEP